MLHFFGKIQDWILKFTTEFKFLQQINPRSLVSIESASKELKNPLWAGFFGSFDVPDLSDLGSTCMCPVKEMQIPFF